MVPVFSWCTTIYSNVSGDLKKSENWDPTFISMLYVPTWQQRRKKIELLFCPKSCLGDLFWSDIFKNASKGFIWDCGPWARGHYWKHFSCLGRIFLIRFCCSWQQGKMSLSERTVAIQKHSSVKSMICTKLVKMELAKGTKMLLIKERKLHLMSLVVRGRARAVAVKCFSFEMRSPWSFK